MFYTISTILKVDGPLDIELSKVNCLEISKKNIDFFLIVNIPIVSFVFEVLEKFQGFCGYFENTLNSSITSCITTKIFCVFQEFYEYTKIY